MNFKDYLNKNGVGVSYDKSNTTRTNDGYGVTISFDDGKRSGNSYSKSNHYAGHETYDNDEVDMVLGDLKKINDLSCRLYDMIKKGDCDLEDWLQVKISQACDRVSTAHDYLKYKE